MHKSNRITLGHSQRRHFVQGIQPEQHFRVLGGLASGPKRVDVTRQAHGPGQNAVSVSVYRCADVNKPESWVEIGKNVVKVVRTS